MEDLETNIRLDPRVAAAVHSRKYTITYNSYHNRMPDV